MRNDLREWLFRCNELIEVGLLKTAADAREIIEDFAYHPNPPPVTLPVLDDRTPEEICGYGDDGLCSH